MSRKITDRIVFQGVLKAQSGISVGGLNSSEHVDTLFAEDGKGRLYISGTSLTGALRAWFERAYSEQDAQSLFGFSEKTEGCASSIYVHDSVITHNNAIQSEIRDGVGIDRYSGTAANRIKYNRQILPAGTTFGFKLVLEIPESVQDCSENIVRIAHMMDALQKGEIKIGAAKTRGLGKITLDEGVSFEYVQMNTKAGVLSMLENRTNERPLDLKEIYTQFNVTDGAYAPKVFDRINMKIRWQPEGPLMVKSSVAGAEIDMIPLTSKKGGEDYQVLPGSAVKGILRCHSERIINTLYPSEEKKEFQETIETHAIVKELFGATAEYDDKQEGRLGLGALAIEDCYAQTTFASTTKKKSTHVGIDRWTGGAAKGYLYDIQEPHDVKWEELALSVDVARLSPDSAKLSVLLLMLCLRDLIQGIIKVGFAVNRGMGVMKVAEIEVDAPCADGMFEPLHGLCITHGDFDQYQEQLDFLNTAWVEYNAQNEVA